MRTLATLGATELVYRAAALFVRDGEHGEPLRLLYRALELDPYHVQAHAILSSVLADIGRPAAGAAVLEWTLDDDRPLFGAEREFLARERMRFGACVGFTRPWSGGAGLVGDPDLLLEASFDEVEYLAFFEDVVRAAGSLDGAYRAALTLTGFTGGLLEHESGADSVADDELAHSERFAPSEAYSQWLAGEVD
jgi:hypothetical protein